MGVLCLWCGWMGGGWVKGGQMDEWVGSCVGVDKGVSGYTSTRVGRG